MWKTIKEYEGYYEVSDDGRVRSLDRFIKNKSGLFSGRERFLAGSEMKLTESSGRKDEQGYLVVNLHKDGISSVIPVHILVANAFIPNPHNLPTINHIDGDKHNNSVSNLEWASYADNNIHALINNLRRPRGVAVQQFTMDGDLLKTYKSVTQAAKETGVSRGMISHCVNGRLESASGYKWKKLLESQTTIPKGSTQEDELPAEAQRPH